MPQCACRAVPTGAVATGPGAGLDSGVRRNDARSRWRHAVWFTRPSYRRRPVPSAAPDDGCPLQHRSAAHRRAVSLLIGSFTSEALHESKVPTVSDDAGIIRCEGRRPGLSSRARSSTSAACRRQADCPPDRRRGRRLGAARRRCNGHARRGHSLRRETHKRLKAIAVLTMLDRLGVKPSYSRHRASDEHANVESLCKSAKFSRSSLFAVLPIWVWRTSARATSRTGRTSSIRHGGIR